MDNLTHSLVGALLSQAGLKKLTGRATATLVIAANLPDIDAFATLLGTESLAIRRGITHGPIALLVLPVVLWGIMLAWDRWRPAKQEVKPLPLLGLAYLGALTHPALDWLNSYGIRLLEPFSSRWVAADTLFIIDIWLWLILAMTFTLGKLRERRGNRRWFVPARYGLGLILGYIGLNGLITAQAENQGARLVQAQYRIQPELVVANPVPVRFWARNILWRGEGVHGRGDYLFLDGPSVTGRPRDIALDHPVLTAQRDRSDVEAFLFWSRMPFIEERDGRVWLRDQRFDSEMTRDAFRVDLGDTDE
ncbi:metal-dependent hydrolase [Sphingomicrobium clamense]|uniref:Metal-dependent hydrolase n=1 Tax=Sphingomicrobium clamense TaxID=2851013 RepID=A0ABS6V7N3_9SPHN|nr:metal-dependent hydrolase [Sphingomicrobium sp. B8]MBW0145524.1 metal-dependent hydrolase [Sphingomicrobium sp. B8]